MTDDQIEKAIETHNRRRNAFMAEGLSEVDAWILAEQMWNRDKDPHDDRRVCFECKGYIAGKCTKITDKWKRPTDQLRFVLQRCDHFELKGKKPLTDEELHQIDASNQHQGRDE